MKFTYAVAMLLFSSTNALSIKGPKGNPETGPFCNQYDCQRVIHICNGANAHTGCVEPDNVHNKANVHNTLA